MKAETTILVAMTDERVIGKKGAIPWHIPEELRLFRQLTLGHAVVMGRRTFESIGRPLPGRLNIVLSRSLPPSAGIVVCADLRQGLAEAAAHGAETFIIGGREVYRQTLPFATFLRISWIRQRCDGDVLFPPFHLSAWEEMCSRDYPQFRHACYRRLRQSPVL